MSLSPNPFGKSFGDVGSLFSSATNSFTSGGGASLLSSFSSAKKNLEGTVNRLSGGIGSSLNGLTSGLPNLGTALGGGKNPIQSALGGLSNIASDIGQSINKFGLGGALGNVGQIAGAISSAAGIANNLLSMARGKNLPSGAELFQQQGAFVSLATTPGDDWRVRINANFGLFGGAFERLAMTNGVVWPYTPKITISTRANYTTIDPVHNNFPFQAYKNSQIEDINISGEFSCETEQDAEYWIAATHFFKTATKMFFGGGEYAGNPPIVCNLSGYGPGVFNQVPVIIKSFSIDMPDDVNYIKCQTGLFSTNPTWVPVVSTISITVAPIYNRTKLREFSLQDYAKGEAIGYM
jgi:hypothetical protein